MVYHLPELDRISRALSRLETALLTYRPTSSDNDEQQQLVPLAEYQRVQEECQQMQKMLRQTHLLLADLLQIDTEEGTESEAETRMTNNKLLEKHDTMMATNRAEKNITDPATIGAGMNRPTAIESPQNHNMIDKKVEEWQK